MPKTNAATTATANPFDFTDLSDLPAELAAKLATESKSTSAREWAAVVEKAAEFGIKTLDINQIMAGATRMGMTVPTDQTVRGYLNKAVELGLIAKPTRQTYGLPLGKARTKAEDIGLDGAEVVTGDIPEVPGDAVDTDPLAALGL